MFDGERRSGIGNQPAASFLFIVAQDLPSSPGSFVDARFSASGGAKSRIVRPKYEICRIQVSLAEIVVHLSCF